MKLGEWQSGVKFLTLNEAKIGMESRATVESHEMAVRWWACEVLQIPVSFEHGAVSTVDTASATRLDPVFLKPIGGRRAENLVGICSGCCPLARTT